MGGVANSDYFGVDTEPMGGERGVREWKRDIVGGDEEVICLRSHTFVYTNQISSTR